MQQMGIIGIAFAGVCTALSAKCVIELKRRRGCRYRSDHRLTETKTNRTTSTLGIICEKHERTPWRLIP